MAQSGPSSGVVLFWEDGFPATDISAISRSQADEVFSGYRFANAHQLAQQLQTAKVLVLPCGSSFPAEQWPAIRQFLVRGGNLVVLGGRAFTRPVFRAADGKWKYNPETQAYARELRIYGYQPISGEGLTFTPNADLAGAPLPSFAWNNAWSLVIRLSEKATSEREGAAGSLDARLHPLAWGSRNGHKLSAPAVEIDHIQHAFVGGRWELLTCDPGPGFWSSPVARQIVRTLVDRAAQGASEFRVQPNYAVVASGEPWRFELTWTRPGATPRPLRIEFTLESDGSKPRAERLDFIPSHMPFEIGFELKPSPRATGLQRVTARLFENKQLVAIYQTGFWMRDESMLRSGPAVSKDSDFFLVNGKPASIVGTTYMAGDVQRLYLEYPNPVVWDRDMEQIAGAGLNMLRTGCWTGWNGLSENGKATEKTLRAIEAYLLTARRHNLPVQFTVFAFTPDMFGGKNPYLDPTATNTQSELVRSLAARLHDVPYLIWDVINEPSFSNLNRTWNTRPNGDDFELRAWNDWLLRRYQTHAAIAATWHTIPIADDQPLALPTDADFTGRGPNASPARAYDYHLFAQESFAAWAAKMRDAIRETGSRQLITAGQDEGGVTNRPLAAFFVGSVDFTTNHTWWLNDALLWDSLAAKQPGLPLLIQETGIQHESNLDGTPRLTDQDETQLFERKMAIALATSGGAIQWLWNTNAFMMPEMELTIGAIRPDGTEKPEADVLRKFAKFARDSSELLRNPVPPDVVVVTSQALQFSPYGDQALAAQQRAVRALHYSLHLPASVLAENQLDHLGTPKLVILPSPQAFTQTGWNHLLAYVSAGGHLLVTGPVERDEHWAPVKRVTALSQTTRVEPLLSHYSELQFGTDRVLMTFEATAQRQLERLTLPQFVTDIPVGSGHIYATADPVELADSPDATIRLYHQIATALELGPAFDLKSDTKSVLIRSTETRDAVLYLFVSEAAHDHTIGLKDHATGMELNFNLPSQRSRIAIIRKFDHAVIWSPE